IDAEVFAHAEGRQLIMAKLRQALGCLAAQERDQMLGAKPLAGTGHGGQRFLRQNGAIDQLDALKAKVAVAARLSSLAEIGEQRLPPAAWRCAQRDKRIEPPPLDALLLIGGLAVLDLLAAQAHVVEAIKGQRRGWQAVPPRPSDLLIIGLDGFGQI